MIDSSRYMKCMKFVIQKGKINGLVSIFIKDGVDEMKCLDFCETFQNFHEKHHVISLSEYEDLT